eukprot:828736-Alexandrium_andersonii.AAC.1
MPVTAFTTPWALGLQKANRSVRWVVAFGINDRTLRCKAFAPPSPVMSLIKDISNLKELPNETKEASRRASVASGR